MGVQVGHSHRNKRPAIVIDTNVLIDAMIGWVDHDHAKDRHRNARFLLEQSFSRFKVCFTRPSMQEFCEVALDLKGRTNMRPTDAMARVNFIKYVEARMHMVEPRCSELVCRDKKDQMILEAAAGANARHIISADQDILTLGRERNRSFIHPFDFASQLSTQVHVEFQRAQQRGKAQVYSAKGNLGHKQRGHANGNQKPKHA